MFRRFAGGTFGRWFLWVASGSGRGLKCGARMEDFEGLRKGNFWDLHVGAIEGALLGDIDGILVSAVEGDIEGTTG